MHQYQYTLPVPQHWHHQVNLDSPIKTQKKHNSEMKSNPISNQCIVLNTLQNDLTSSRLENTELYTFSNRKNSGLKQQRQTWELKECDEQKENNVTPTKTCALKEYSKTALKENCQQQYNKPKTLLESFLQRLH